MREHFASFYFMFPVLIPTLAVLGWVAVTWIYDTIKLFACNR